MSNPGGAVMESVRFKIHMVKHDVGRHAMMWTHAFMRRVPRRLIYFAVIRAAVVAAGDHKNPGAVTSVEMMHAMRPDEGPVPIDNGAVLSAAAAVFDNRLGWGDGRQPYIPRDLLADLGEALGREPELVAELRS